MPTISSIKVKTSRASLKHINSSSRATPTVLSRNSNSGSSRLHTLRLLRNRRHTSNQTMRHQFQPIRAKATTFPINSSSQMGHFRVHRPTLPRRWVKVDAWDQTSRVIYNKVNLGYQARLKDRFSRMRISKQA
jgi:hypothetical protein